MNILLLALLLFSSIIIAHEMGHFIAAKAMNVKVEKFSLGFGPSLLRRKIGETEFQLSLILLGGYVRLFGENPAAQVEAGQQHRSYSAQPTWKKAVIVSMGSIANVIFAILLMVTVYLCGIQAKTSAIGEVLDGSSASVAGIHPGDRISNINGVAVERWEQCRQIIEASAGKELEIEIDRDGRKLVMTLVVSETVVTDALKRQKSVGTIGLAPRGDTMLYREQLPMAIWKALEKSYEMVALIFAAIVEIARGNISLTELGGPIMIVKAVKDQIRLGFVNFLVMVAFLNINIGVMNLLPIPAFDGGHLVILSIEAYRGRQFNPKTVLTLQRIGVSLIIVLMVFVMWNDLQRIRYLIQ